jgi:hypothetical protein
MWNHKYSLTFQFQVLNNISSSDVLFFFGMQTNVKKRNIVFLVNSKRYVIFTVMQCYVDYNCFHFVVLKIISTVVPYFQSRVYAS